MKNESTRRQRRKPDFAKKGAIWEDDEYFPEELENVLRNELRPRRWSKDQTDDFMRLLAGRVHVQVEFKDVQAQTDKKKALQAVEKSAHSLLLALEALNGTEALEEFEACILGWVNGRQQPVALSWHCERIVGMSTAVSGWWDVVHDIEQAAGNYVDKVLTGKGMRPSQQHTRRLVNAAAGAVRDVTGSLPRTSKGTWFPEFARVLCEGFDALPCGVELVAEVVKEMQPPG